MIAVARRNPRFFGNIVLINSSGGYRRVVISYDELQ
jgi:hypothetical protein